MSKGYIRLHVRKLLTTILIGGVFTTMGVSTVTPPNARADFLRPERWSSTRFFGDRATLIGDVTGDSRADLVAVNGDASAGSSWVMGSTGSSFTAPQRWSSSRFFGNKATLIGDINGDRLSDLIAVNESSPTAGDTWVMTSTGSSFTAPQRWSSSRFFGNKATLIGDINRRPPQRPHRRQRSCVRRWRQLGHGVYGIVVYGASALVILALFWEQGDPDRRHQRRPPQRPHRRQRVESNRWRYLGHDVHGIVVYGASALVILALFWEQGDPDRRHQPRWPQRPHRRQRVESNRWRYLGHDVHGIVVYGASALVILALFWEQGDPDRRHQRRPPQRPRRRQRIGRHQR